MSTAESSLVTESFGSSGVFQSMQAVQGVHVARPGESITSGHIAYGRALVALCIGVMTLMPAVYATQPVLPLLGHDFHLSAGAAGLTLAVFNLALAAAVLVMGPLSDRIGRRPIIVVVSLLIVIPTALAAIAPTYNLLLMARAAQGILAAGVGAIGIAYIGDEFPAQRRATAIGWYAMAMSFSALVGRVGGGMIAGMYGWRAMFLALAALSLVGALTLALGLPAASRFRPSDGIRSAFRHMIATLRVPVLAWGYLAGFLLGIALLGFFTYVSYLLSGSPFNLSTTALALIFLLYVLGMMSPVAGSLSTRVGRRPVIAVALGLMIIGILMTLSHHLPVVIAGIGVMVLGLLTAYAMMNALVSDHARGRRGAAAALYLCNWYAGGALGAWIFGPVWAVGAWPAVVAGTLGVTLLTLLALLGTHQSKRAQQTHDQTIEMVALTEA